MTSSSVNRIRWMTRRFALAFVLAYPGLVLAAIQPAWPAARWSQGHGLRPFWYDPKSIGLWVDVPYLAAVILLMVGLPMFVLGWAGLLVGAALRSAERHQLLFRARWAALVSALGIGPLRRDPGAVAAWFAD